MVDTVKTLSELQSAFADGQAANAITEQDVRDLIVSTVGQRGWADYQDTQYTDLSPQSLPSGVATAVQINSGVSQTQELPVGATELWNVAGSNIPVTVPGTSLLVTFETIIRRASGTAVWSLEVYIDIGLPGPVKLYPRTITVTKAGDDKITFTTGVYCLDTWVANGGQIIIEPTVDAEIYKSRVVVHQLHRGRGTY